MTNSFGPTGSADNFGFLLIETARLLRQASERSVENNGLGLTPGDIRTLGYAMRYAGSRQSVLAERMDIEPMTLSVFLDRLEERGLVARIVDPADRRAKQVRPTPRALEVVRALDPGFAALYASATAGLSEAAMEEVAGALRAIRANLTQDPAITAPFSLLSPAGTQPKT